MQMQATSRSHLHTSSPVSRLPSPVSGTTRVRGTAASGAAHRQCSPDPICQRGGRQNSGQQPSASVRCLPAAAGLEEPWARTVPPPVSAPRADQFRFVASLTHTADVSFPFNSSATTTSQSLPEEESDGGRKKLAVHNHQHRISQRPDQRRSEPSLPECW